MEKKWGNFIDINEANLDVPVTPSLWLNIGAPMIPELPRQVTELREKKNFKSLSVGWYVTQHTYLTKTLVPRNGVLL